MSNIKYAFLTVVCAVLIFVAVSCDMKRDSLGSLDKIIIIADSTQWAEIGDDVLAVMQKQVYTPQPELIFNLLQKNPEDLNKLTRFPNLLVVGTLDIEGRMRELLDKLLAGSQSRVQSDSPAPAAVRGRDARRTPLTPANPRKDRRLI